MTVVVPEGSCAKRPRDLATHEPSWIDAPCPEDESPADVPTEPPAHQDRPVSVWIEEHSGGSRIPSISQEGPAVKCCLTTILHQAHLRGAHLPSMSSRIRMVVSNSMFGVVRLKHRIRGL